MKSYWWNIFQWFSNTPYRSLDRAYKASKRIRCLKKNSSSYVAASPPRDLSRALIAHINIEFNSCIVTIYWSLLECRTSIYVSKISNNLKFFFIGNSFQSLFLNNQILPPYEELREEKISSKDDSHNGSQCYPPKVSLLPSVFSRYLPNYYNGNRMMSGKRNKINGSLENQSEDYRFARRSISKVFSKMEKMNKKLSWIEATLTDSDVWKRRRYPTIPSFQQMTNNSNKDLFISDSLDSSNGTTAYESISLIPRSIIRTLFRFKTELTSQSSLLVLNDFRLAKYQALASIQYIGCLLFIPLTIQILLQNWFLEPWIRNWWNTSQLQIFISLFQEEGALKRLQEIEGLLWLDEVVTDPVDIQSRYYDLDAYAETIQLVIIYSEGNIRIISHLVTDVISIVTPISLLVVGRKRLAVLNPWIQELFYSLNDTMKAFFILLLTDLFIGFHSPHGWEIVIGYFSEHFGFAHDKYVIPCFVSTFPVISDTVFKYWIFRHLNRISPSIVATYHTMNE
uniref:chloroplast envelope membrane protein n=1 Tax=Diplopterygium chinense TaxID=397680 RepID=UPI0020294879|nr:chloroplast envelope membrane protein [Diplopterygium chinense]QYC92977.1 chloroplast envelope membrane protein [Diplopterygium chinense]